MTLYEASAEPMPYSEPYPYPLADEPIYFASSLPTNPPRRTAPIPTPLPAGPSRPFPAAQFRDEQARQAGYGRPAAVTRPVLGSEIPTVPNLSELPELRPIPRPPLRTPGYAAYLTHDPYGQPYGVPGSPVERGGTAHPLMLPRGVAAPQTVRFAPVRRHGWLRRPWRMNALVVAMILFGAWLAGMVAGVVHVLAAHP
jgi:hypothetical protein